MANAIELYGGHSMTHSNDYRPCAPRPSLTYCKLVTVLDIRENLAPIRDDSHASHLCRSEIVVGSAIA